MKKLLIIVFVILSFASCKKETPDTLKNLTIFYVNDVHGQIDNFAKVKYIIDQERQKTNVIVSCAGDIFSGNPVVDIYSPKGYPMIDIMNTIDFDIMAVGNHEFDYGESIFKDRNEQADFPWISANINTENSVIPELPAYKTISAGNIKVTFLGLIETNGKQDDVIPSTHPLKIQNLSFQKAENIVSQYANLKETENSDLYIALTHLGIYSNKDRFSDFDLAKQFPYFDIIIGGHTNNLLDTLINNIPVLQAGCYLNYLGKTELEIKDKKITSMHSELIDLNGFQTSSAALNTVIQNYDNSMSFLDDVIGYSYLNHGRYQIGCFYTDAFHDYMNVDVAFQNSGGVRAGLDEGNITKREIYAISPFNNGTLIYSMTVAEIKNFLIGSDQGMYYSGIQIEQVGSNIEITDTLGNIIPDNTSLTIGINDYIPAVFDTYFPSSGIVQNLTAAETLIACLETINGDVNYPDCNCYFRYQ
ncbi:MAG: hypothetical protein DRI94_08225 [Bacteroidetes bacterium]|nr:MAG: hypothetical protein DRI94_08225 [Bacteroidota bacterium]